MQETEKPRIHRERRRHNSGAPVGCTNRRSGKERRLPAVKNLSLSGCEWETYFSTPINPSEKSDFKTQQALAALAGMLSPHGSLGHCASSNWKSSQIP